MYVSTWFISEFYSSGVRGPETEANTRTFDENTQQANIGTSTSHGKKMSNKIQWVQFNIEKL